MNNLLLLGVGIFLLSRLKKVGAIPNAQEVVTEQKREETIEEKMADDIRQEEHEITMTTETTEYYFGDRLQFIDTGTGNTAEGDILEMYSNGMITFNNVVYIQGGERISIPFSSVSVHRDNVIGKIIL